MNAEAVLALVDHVVALLRDHRRDQDLGRIQLHFDPSSREADLRLRLNDRERSPR